MTYLRVLQLGGNDFVSESVPSWMTLLTQLSQLELENINLQSTLPQSWSVLTRLTRLYAYANEIAGKCSSAIHMLRCTGALGSTGTIPNAWTSLTGLQELVIHGNFITGMSIKVLPPQLNLMQ